jgi:hypothetical protein
VHGYFQRVANDPKHIFSNGLPTPANQFSSSTTAFKAIFCNVKIIDSSRNQYLRISVKKFSRSKIG